jgi:sugar lactone lactonase YvrE
MILRLVLMLIVFPITVIAMAQTVNVQASVAFTIEEKDLIPEGITYDPGTHQFFVSSINKEKVVAVSENGIAHDFIRRGQDGILQTLGMKVDVIKRRLCIICCHR